MIRKGDIVRHIDHRNLMGVVKSVRIERPENPPNIFVVEVDLGSKVRVDRVRYFDSTVLRVVRKAEEVGA